MCAQQGRLDTKLACLQMDQLATDVMQGTVLARYQAAN